ncbi:MAG: hypothetical protein EKK64_06090 [Neisseriaceae bacterium]|nr:MAG: hypothetical protein EKK64_06090 [Neisseriaceae bacterium]
MKSDGSTQSIVLSEVAFSSSNPAVASVTDTGEVKAVGVGSTTITATYNGKTATLGYTVTAHQLQSIVINADHASIAKGTATEVSATGVYTDGNQDITTQVLFSSDNGNVSFSSGYDDNTVVYGNEVGTSNITASMNGVSSDPILFKVTAATLDSLTLTSNAGTNLPKGAKSQLNVIGTMSDGSQQVIVPSEVAFTSSHKNVLSINSKGVVQTLLEGSSTVTAIYNGKTAELPFMVTAHQLTEVTVQLMKASIAKGTATNVSAAAVYSDGIVPVTSEAVFSSDNGNVSFSTSSDNQVLAHGNSAGYSYISATYNGMTSSPSMLHVTDAIVTGVEVDGESTIVKGYSTQLIAQLVMSDGSKQPATNVAWRSMSGNFNVTDTGLVTANSSVPVGSYTNIWVNANGMQSDLFKLTLTDPALLSTFIQIDDRTGQQLQRLPLYKDGKTALYLAVIMGNFSDGSQHYVVGSYNWQYQTNDYFSIDTYSFRAYSAGGPINVVGSVWDPVSKTTVSTPSTPIGVY